MGVLFAQLPSATPDSTVVVVPCPIPEVLEDPVPTPKPTLVVIFITSEEFGRTAKTEGTNPLLSPLDVEAEAEADAECEIIGLIEERD